MLLGSCTLNALQPVALGQNSFLYVAVPRVHALPARPRRPPWLPRAARLRLWSEHLERDDVEGDPTRLVDEVWRPLAEEQLARRRRDNWAPHRLTLLPHVSRRVNAIWGPLNGLVVDG